ncbi:MAG: hypothetical protein SF172_13485 [Burkholderiales bacterium]|nr:hypothetical protein [Burkholderiales bacterium]
MQIYWTLKGIPELAHLPARSRLLAWQQVSWNSFRHWQTWMGLLLAGVCAGIGSHFGTLCEYPVSGAALGGALGGFVFAQISISIVRRHYRDQLTAVASEAASA